ncbi:hypothetical protein ABZU32_04035 [Sphaerisporangium sp. NPDC005288]|uniref:hypothetical protein n=1 Tax=Sphaerisporangium sp. NPDC005288 TaxID=3155114 RepID=UPI0033AD334B
MTTRVWTCVLDWSASHGDLDPSVCVVQAEDPDTATDQAITLTSAHFVGVNEDWRTEVDIAEQLFPILTFHGDLSGLVASPSHCILRSPGSVDHLEGPADFTQPWPGAKESAIPAKHKPYR